MKPLRFTQETIADIAKRLLSVAPGKIWAIYGGMGAGKTTLIKALLRELGSDDLIGSPTFGLVNEYTDRDGKVLAYHFDFYRLEEPEEVLDIGIEEYLETDTWIFMEWPERIAAYLPEDRWELVIEALDENTRIIREGGGSTKKNTVDASV